MAIRQINFRCDSELIDRLDEKALSMSLDRSSAIKLAINQLIDGPSEAPVTPSATSSVDVQAREASTRLLARIEALEEQEDMIRAMKRQLEAMTKALAKDEAMKKAQTEKPEPKESSFSDLF